MKRIVLGAAIWAALVLLCLTAFAGDAAPATANLASELGKHWAVTLMAGVIPVIRTVLSDDTVKLPVWAAKHRVYLISLLGLVATAAEQITNGLSLGTAFLAFVVSAAPALIQELVKHLAGDNGKPSSSSGAGSGGGIRPPAGNPTMMSGDISTAFAVPRVYGKIGAPLLVVVGALALLAFGCAAKGLVCPTLKLLSDSCDKVIIMLPDGTSEVVSKDAIVGMAMSARAARVAGAAQGAPDAGADSK